MTSVLRTFSQIPVREKYLLAVIDSSGGNTDNVFATNVEAFSITSGAYIDITSVATEADISNAAGVAVYNITAGWLFKDLGRQITVYDPADHKHLAVYRQVQYVSGGETEGVCNAANYCANIFVKVWSADGAGVVVVRTG